MSETPVVALDIARNPWELFMLRLLRQIPEEKQAEASAAIRAIGKGLRQEAITAKRRPHLEDSR